MCYPDVQDKNLTLLQEYLYIKQYCVVKVLWIYLIILLFLTSISFLSTLYSLVPTFSTWLFSYAFIFTVFSLSILPIDFLFWTCLCVCVNIYNISAPHKFTKFLKISMFMLWRVVISKRVVFVRTRFLLKSSTKMEEVTKDMELRSTLWYCSALSLKQVVVVWSLRNHVWLICNPMIIACQAALSTGFLRQEYWNGLPFPYLGDLLDPGTEAESPALQVDSLLPSPEGSPTEASMQC